MQISWLAIYKHDREVEQGSTNEQLQLSVQSGTRTRNFGRLGTNEFQQFSRIASPIGFPTDLVPRSN